MDMDKSATPAHPPGWGVLLLASALTSCVTAAFTAYFVYQYRFYGLEERGFRIEARVEKQPSEKHAGPGAKSAVSTPAKGTTPASTSTVRPLTNSELDAKFNKAMPDVVDIFIFHDIKSSFSNAIKYARTDEGKNRISYILARGTTLLNDKKPPTPERVTWDGYVDNSEENAVKTLVLKADLVANAEYTAKVGTDGYVKPWWFPPGQSVRCQGVCSYNDKTHQFSFTAGTVVPITSYGGTNKDPDPKQE
jgi:hypothetical protein